jgi:serine/threonine protein kinase
MSDYPPKHRIPGTVYEVVRLIGQGGMGTVYEVEDTTVGKRYVLKTLHAELRDHKELAARLNKEARALARLSHRNIVEAVTAGITTDELRLPYFVMQKLDGLTLRAVLNAKGRLPLATAYSIAIDLLDALDHAHGLGIIHRDVKPENLFLHRDTSGASVTKLLDFGVVRMLSGDAQSGGRFVGTLRYAPPEQIKGGPITPRADLYAAALVLYEMIAGYGPFDDYRTERAIARAHMEKPAPSLSTRVGNVPPELDLLLASALSKDPERRPRDAFTFASRLRELSTEAIEAWDPSSPNAFDALPALPASAPPATTLDTPLTYAEPRGAKVAVVAGLVALGVLIAAVIVAVSPRTSTTRASAATRPAAVPSAAPMPSPRVVESAPMPPRAPATATPSAAPSVSAPKAAAPKPRAAPAAPSPQSAPPPRPGPGF